MFRTMLIPGLMAVSLAACQTANRPAEFTTAEEAISNAHRADLNNSMPRAMELADNKMDEAKKLFKESESALKDGNSAKSDELRQRAISRANEVTAIVNAGMNLRDDVKAFDSNLATRGDTDALMSENRSLKEQLAEIRNRSGEAGLRDFEIAKPVAYFDTASSKIKGNFAEEISQVAATMKEHPELYLTLEGFADPRGSDRFNQKLSEKRAQAVMQKFVSEGIPADRIRTHGKGAIKDTRPSDLAGLQLDRKVVAKFSTVAH